MRVILLLLGTEGGQPNKQKIWKIPKFEMTDAMIEKAKKMAPMAVPWCATSSCKILS